MITYEGKFTSKSHAGKITHRRKCEGACSISLQAFFLTQHEIHNSFDGGLKKGRCPEFLEMIEAHTGWACLQTCDWALSKDIDQIAIR